MGAAVRASVECLDDFGSASTVARTLAEGIGNHSAKGFLMRIGADDADRTPRNRPESGLLCCRGFLRRSEVIMIAVKVPNDIRMAVLPYPIFHLSPARGRRTALPPSPGSKEIPPPRVSPPQGLSVFTSYVSVVS